MSDKTVTVRILVIVDGHGDWAAAGHSGADFGDLIYCADDLDGGLETQAWVTAELPLPPKPIEHEASIESVETVDPET